MAHPLISLSTHDLSASDVQRFRSRVLSSDPVNCWLWTRARDKDGYGKMHLLGREFRAHRVAWVLANGLLPTGLIVMHKCDNPPCCNPAHLCLGTHLDNARDRDSKGRGARGDTHSSRTKPHRVARGDRTGARRHPERVCRGSRSPQSKLTETQVSQIRERVKNGELQKHLAVEFGVTAACVCQIVLRQHWKHV